jgi:hypothetical protein
MSLIPFHRLLIACAILFCLGYAAWELAVYARTGGLDRLAFSGAFALAAALLAVYLRHLRRVLRLPASPRRLDRPLA